MKCQSCGFENEQDFCYCPNCGAPVQENAPEASIVPTNSAADKILHVLQDPLFFVLCILMSVSCAIQVISSSWNVLTILFTIFLWLVYGQARKGIADPKYLRNISGTVYAQYIIVNILAVLVIVIGAALSAAFGTLFSNPTFLEEIFSTLEIPLADAAIISEALVSVSGTVIFAFFAICGAGMLVINLFSTRYIHRFAKSVYQSVLSGTLELKHSNTAYGWLLAFGIINGLSFLGSLSSGNIGSILLSGISGAMPIFAAILMKKYLLSSEA